MHVTETEFAHPMIRVNAGCSGYRPIVTNQPAQITVHQTVFVLETRHVRALKAMKIRIALRSRVPKLVDAGLRGSAQGPTLAPAKQDIKVEIAILRPALEYYQQRLECVMEMVRASPSITALVVSTCLDKIVPSSSVEPSNPTTR